jgi:hypothetical protein
MSHGCDSADFEAILGYMPENDVPPVEQHVLFLLENPGGQYRNGEKRKFGCHQKEPQVNRYY